MRVMLSALFLFLPIVAFAQVKRTNPPVLTTPTGYTHVVEVTGPAKTVYISGQIAYDKDGKVVGAGDMKAQAEQVFKNLQAALAAAGAKFSDVVKMNSYITDMSKVQAVRDVHIIKVTPEGAMARMMANHAPQDQILQEAAKHVGRPKKTDIVVFDHKPWHMVNGQLRPHPQVHLEDSETILKISFKQQERPCWWSEQPFRITRIEHSHHSTPGSNAPDYPFASGQPPLPGQPELDNDGQEIFVARCPPIVAGAVGQTYKINFFMGEDIDPDMEGTP